MLHMMARPWALRCSSADEAFLAVRWSAVDGEREIERGDKGEGLGFEIEIVVGG